MSDEACVEIRSEGTVAVVAFCATSISNADGIAAAAEQIKEFITRNDPSSVVFDFSRVKFFSSQVLGLLVDIRSRLQAEGSEVVISGIAPELYRVFRITNLDKLFKFFPDKDSAVAAVRTGAA